MRLSVTSGTGLLNSFSTGVVHSVDNFHSWNYGVERSAEPVLTCDGAIPGEQGVHVFDLCTRSSTPVDNVLHPLCTRWGSGAVDHG